MRMTPDERLAHRALKEKWCVPSKIRPSLIRVLSGIALNKRAAARARIIAIKTLLSVDLVNNAAVRTLIVEREHGELLAECLSLRAEIDELKKHDRQASE